MTWSTILNPWWAKGVIIAATVVMFAIRAPHGQRSRGVKIAKDCKDRREIIALALAMIGFFVPLIWLVSPALSFAEYPLRLGPFIAGVICFVVGLWVFYRSHADLGTNWSVTLQVREQHRLVAHGIYARVRHPMYTGLFLYSIGQALVLPNWIAGPSYLVPFAILFALRVGAEERMMLAEFGNEYSAYMAKTKRLIPGVW